MNEVIYSYTRAMAVEDGVLVDVSDQAREAGFSIPVAMTAEVWADCVAWTEHDNQGIGQDQDGRLWDVLWMSRNAAVCNRERSQVHFHLYRVPRGIPGADAEMVELKLVIGPGDDGEPVITIMFPNQD